MCCSTCYCFAVCTSARAEEAQACKVQEEITRLGKLALQLLREGEGGGAYFTSSLARAAYEAAGEEIPEYLKISDLEGNQ